MHLPWTSPRTGGLDAGTCLECIGSPSNGKETDACMDKTVHYLEVHLTDFAEIHASDG